MAVGGHLARLATQNATNTPKMGTILRMGATILALSGTIWQQLVAKAMIRGIQWPMVLGTFAAQNHRSVKKL